MVLLHPFGGWEWGFRLPSNSLNSAPQLASIFSSRKAHLPVDADLRGVGCFFYVKRMVKNQSLLGGGFIFFKFSSLPNWEMIQFDKHIFQRG